MRHRSRARTGLAHAEESAADPPVHQSRAEIAATALFICVLEEAWEELTSLTRASITPPPPSETGGARTSRWSMFKLRIHVPILKLAAEVEGQLWLARAALESVPPEQQAAPRTK